MPLKAQNQQDFVCTCTNGDFETGTFANWSGQTGFCCGVVMTANGIVNGRHTIMSGNGLDPNSCNKVKVNSPGTGTFSARLGNSFVGAEAERLRFTFTVNPNNYLFIYKYAVILEDPGHPLSDQPRFEVSLLNGANQVIDPTCGHYLFVSGSNMGSQWKSCGSSVRYKDWETVGLDLTPYDGQTITIEFTTADCAQGGHFGYAYLDAFCSPLKVTTKYCTGANTAILTAPDGFKYVWTPGNLTTKSITINNPVNGTVYTCNMTSILNPTCKATIKSVLQPIDVVADFTTSSLCYNNVQFADASNTPVNTTISSWKWTFGDPPSGPKNAATISAPTHSYPADGPYNVTLIVTNNAGCVDTVTKQIVTIPVPDAQFTATSVCLGEPTLFNDNSTLKSGTITSWNWDFGDNTSSTQANPSHTYALPGPYNVSLVVSSASGCSDTLKKQVMVNPKPTPKFTTQSLCLNASSTFTNTSTITSGAIQAWSWNFGEPSSGPQNTSLLQNPAHAFSTCGGFNVKLVATSDKGCKDSIVTPVNVDCLPVADFSSVDVCKENPTSFSDQSTITTGTINNWHWSFGNTDTANAASPIYTYPACGAYQVSLIVTTGSGCKDTATKTVTVYCKPIADFTTNNVCFNQQPVNFINKSTISSGIISGYAWDLGDGGVSNIPNFTHSYPSKSTYAVNLITTSDHGCKDTVNKQITIFPSPKAAFTNSLACFNSSTVFNDQSTITGSVINSWNWNFGDGGKSAVKDPSHFFNMVSTYNVSLVVTTADGCKDSISQPATVNVKPVAAFSATQVCLNNPSQFTNASSIVAGNITSNNWWFGDGIGLSNQADPTYSYATDSTYQVKLLVVSNVGCRDSVTKPVLVYPIPKPNFTVNKVCLQNASAFVDSSHVKNGNISTWFYDFGDNSNSILASPGHAYAACGDYNASLTVFTNFGCTASKSKPVKVYCLPVADYMIPDVCITNASVFGDASSISNGTIQSWSWNFGDAQSSNSKNTTHTYKTCGSYQVGLTVTTSEGCKNTKIDTAVVHCKPVANFTAATVCNGNESVFTDQSTVQNSIVSNWDWDFGDGVQVSGKDPNYLYGNCGLYAVNMIVSSPEGCKDTIMKAATVNCKPNAEFSSTKICLNKTTSFQDQSSISAGNIVQYNWDFGDFMTGTGLTPAHKYVNCGTYNGVLIVTSNLGCKDTAMHPVTVNCGPTSDFSVTDVCLNNASIFTDKSTVINEVITQWDWDFNEPSSGIFNSSSNPNDAHTYAACGKYNARLITTSANGCKDTVVKPVDVYCLPVADFSTQAVCRKNPSPFTDLSTISSGTVSAYSWDFGDPASGILNSSASKNPKHVYTACGNFEVKFTAISDHLCTNTILKNSLVHCLPEPSFSAPGVCQNYTSLFVDNSSIYNDTITAWNWNFDDLSPASNIQNPSHLYASSGVYHVQLVPTSIKGCRDTLLQDVTVYALPKASFVADTVCFGTSMGFKDLSSAALGDQLIQWDWNFGDMNVSNLQNPSYIYGQQGTYPVSLVVTSNHNCVDTTLSNVEVYPIPVAFFKDSAKGCVPLDVSFSDLSTVQRGNIVSWLWDLGNGDFAGVKNFNYQYNPQITAPVIYNVSLTVTSEHGCVKTYSRPHAVVVNPLPVANFNATPPITSVFKPKIVFTDLSVGNGKLISWNWDFGDLNAANTQNASHAYVDPGMYPVMLIVQNQYGCLDTIRKMVDIQPEFTFYVPNAFTPDGDGINDYFFGSGIGISEYRMDIFDRWGNKIFITTDLKVGWNGKANGGKSIAQQDVYVYVVNLTDVFGEPHKYVGHFSLIR